METVRDDGGAWSLIGLRSWREPPEKIFLPVMSSENGGVKNRSQLPSTLPSLAQEHRVQMNMFPQPNI